MTMEEVLNVDSPPVSKPPARTVSYSHTPRDSMKDTLEDNINTSPPKKRAEKLRESTPRKEVRAGAKSSEVNGRGNIEFVRPNSSSRNKTQSLVFDFSPPTYKQRRVPNGVTNQRYTKSPFATHDSPTSNGNGTEFRPTTPFADHNHLTQEQVFTPRKTRNLNHKPIPSTPSPEKVFKRPPPGGYTNNIFG